MANIAFVNDEFVPLEQAYVHVEDRGYQFGDGVYEVVYAYNGIPFAFEEHMDRFFNSLQSVRIKPAYSREEITSLAYEALERAGYSHAQIYYQMTRGTSKRNHPFPDHRVKSNLVITVREASTFPQERWKNGVFVHTMEDLRWGRCNIKSLNLLPNVLAKQKALDLGGFEAILYKDGYVTEGSATNAYIVSDGQLKTAPADKKILPGITRMQVLKLCRELNIEAHEQPFTLQELYEADEAFLTSSGIEVLPVSKVDNKLIGTGTVGSVTRKLQLAFRQLIADTCFNRISR
ncbi:MAG TPA: D-amino-acid transaminase [Clostridia bacterium]|nr:D-amino-acid transaminase [Clostridia bacterium]